MKFALLTLEYPPTHGGVATYYDGLVRELVKQGHEVEVVTKGLISKWINPHWFAGIVTVWRLLKKQKVDFLIVGHLLPLGTIAYLFRKRVPYIVCTHGMDVALAANVSRKKYLATKILKNAHRVIANSNYTSELVRGFGVMENNISILPPCPQELPAVPHDAVVALRSRLALEGKKVIISVGRLVARKGFDTLVEAMPEILQNIPNAVLIIGGDGPMREKLTQSARAFGVEGSIRILGSLDAETLSALYQLAHVFAMPSRAIGSDVEGFGIVYLEAALFGVPSVAGKSGGAPEAVIDGKTGMVVEPIPAAVSQAITHLLLHDDQRLVLGRAAKEFAGTFSWKNNVEELLKSVAKLQSYPVA